MRLPPLLLTAVLCLSGARGAGAAGIAPADTATMDRLGTIAADPSADPGPRGFDGASTNASYAYTLRNPIDPASQRGETRTRTEQKPPTTPAATVAPKPKDEGPGFFDGETIGFTALGALLGGILGIGLIGALGWAGPVVGMVAGAALLVGLFKWKGYKKE